MQVEYLGQLPGPADTRPRGGYESIWLTFPQSRTNRSPPPVGPRLQRSAPTPKHRYGRNGQKHPGQNKSCLATMGKQLDASDRGNAQKWRETKEIGRASWRERG